MYDIVPWFGVVLAVLVLVFVTLLCVTRSHSYRREQATYALNFKSLCAELKTVTDWHQLGINLGVTADELRRIERDYQGNDRRRAEMLDLWLRCMSRIIWTPEIFVPPGTKISGRTRNNWTPYEIFVPPPSNGRSGFLLPQRQLCAVCWIVERLLIRFQAFIGPTFNCSADALKGYSDRSRPEPSVLRRHARCV